MEAGSKPLQRNELRCAGRQHRTHDELRETIVLVSGLLLLWARQKKRSPDLSEDHTPSQCTEHSALVHNQWPFLSPHMLTSHITTTGIHTDENKKKTKFVSILPAAY
jgi:hypothetical protein